MGRARSGTGFQVRLELESLAQLRFGLLEQGGVRFPTLEDGEYEDTAAAPAK